MIRRTEVKVIPRPQAKKQEQAREDPEESEEEEEEGCSEFLP
jgi:hypothetical protein